MMKKMLTSPGEVLVALWAIAYPLWLTFTPVVDPIELRTIWPGWLITIWFCFLFFGGILILAGFFERLFSPAGYLSIATSTFMLGLSLMCCPVRQEDLFAGGVAFGVSVWMLLNTRRAHIDSLNGKTYANAKSG